MSKVISLYVITLLVLLTSCADSFQEFEAVYGDFIITADRTAARFDGTVNKAALSDLENALMDYPAISSLSIIGADGSSDISSIFSMGKLLKNNNISASISENGEVQKNGLYFFLGGRSRSLNSGARIGVSSWKTSDSEEASSLSIDDSAHDPYIDYLQEIGFSEEKAKSFYFFTLSAAASNDNYWMSSEEINQFGLVN